MKPFGVKVMCIEPGFFKTSVTDYEVIRKNVRMLWERLPKELKEEYGENFISKGIKIDYSSFIKHKCYCL